MTIFSSVDHLKESKGIDLGRTSPVTVSQTRINDFAAVTGDEQWIHVDPERAAEGPFGSTIAHGFLTLSFAGPFLLELLQVDGVSASINYGLNRVRFPSIVASGSVLHGEGRLIDVVERVGAVDAVVELSIFPADSSRPACVAESVIRLVL